MKKKVGSLKGSIFDIKKYSIHDGPGIRTTIFFKGCPLRCQWCHNPESQKKTPEKILKSKSNYLDSAEKYETVGKIMTTEEVMSEIEKDRIFYDDSNGGVTFSGGEPLWQPAFLSCLIDLCQSRAIHTTLDTSGYTSPDIIKSIMDRIDLVLFDVKIMDNQRHLHYTGVENEIILQNLLNILKGRKRIFIRIPIIPQINDDPENLTDILRFISPFPHIEEVSLLPYHKASIAKYKRLNRKIKLPQILPPDEAHLQKIKKLFENQNFKVKIGG